MITVAEVGGAGHTFLMRTSRTRWAEFPFEWLTDLGTGCPPISSSLANINFPQLQVHFQGCYLSYG